MPSFTEGDFALPRAADSEATERARSLRDIALIVAGVVTAALALVALVQPALATRALLTVAVVCGTALLSLLLNRRGHTTLASWTLVGVLIALITANALPAGGIRSPGVQSFFIFVLVGGVLLGRRAGWLVAAICALLGLTLVVLESMGIGVSQRVQYSAFALWLLNGAYIAVMLLTVRVAIRNAEHAAVRARNALAERARLEQEREQLVGELRERVKELRLLHDAARLLQNASAADELVLRDLVERMPAAWLYPEDAAARIRFGGIDVRSRGWAPSPHRQEVSFTTTAGAGSLEVVYRNVHAEADEGPFLVEERALLESLAELLRTHIERETAASQRRSLEAQLRHAQKMDALGTLAGGIAHDFNNILTAIGGHAQLVTYDIGPDHPASESVDEILKAYERARDLVRRILLFSRRQESVKSIVQIAPIVDEAVRLLRASLPSNIAIRVDVADAIPQVLGDSTQLHQVFMNLGTNAGYAMRERGGTLTLSIGTVQVRDVATAPSADLEPGMHVRVGVRDTGTGIPDDVRERLFEPFFTTKGDAGTGLGLSVVHGIVRDHAGAVTVESELGVGTEFAIYLPASDAAGRHVTPVGTVVVGGGEHVMYVDDEPALTLLLQRTLQHLGYRCTTFTDPRLALHAFRGAPSEYAALITDFQMPGMSGLELARAVRRIDPSFPVAITSGYLGERGVEEEVLSVEWFAKPVGIGELSAALHRMLRAR